MDYIIDVRRRLHEYPEVGFDLPRTLTLVKEELTRWGMPYTDKYGKSSLVATLNEDKAHYTIGIRADMDALPIAEKNDIPFKSKIHGQMHACGHDAHTAILLDTVRRLAEIKDCIGCRVKFIFQAAEEFAPGGARLMCEDGLMENIDCMLGLHVDPLCPSGKVSLSPGPSTAISNGFYLNFHGKSAHVASQQRGIDAITMAIKAYMAIELMIAKEIAAKDCCIFNVGSIHGGEANNIICDKCSLFCTLRSWNDETDRKITDRIQKIINAVAMESGGQAEFVESKYYPYVDNHPALTAQVTQVITDLIGGDNLLPRNRGMGAEDFAYYGKQKPACMFYLGMKNEDKGYTASLHQDTFMVDEDVMQLGSDIFVEFVKRYSK